MVFINKLITGGHHLVYIYIYIYIYTYIYIWGKIWQDGNEGPISVAAEKAGDLIEKFNAAGVATRRFWTVRVEHQGRDLRSYTIRGHPRR